MPEGSLQMLDLAGPPRPGTRTTVTAEDGGVSPAHVAVPDEPSGVGLLVLPDLRGLQAVHATLVEALAAEGHHALALDWFGRTAGLEPHDPHWDAFDGDLDATTPPQVTADLRAGTERLHEMGAERVILLGFGFGAAMVLRNVDSGLDVAAAIALYGAAHDYLHHGTAWKHLERAEHTVITLFGGADKGIPDHEVLDVRSALGRSGRLHAVLTYPGAPHGFFDRRGEDYPDECRDVWRRVLTVAHGVQYMAA